MLSLKVQTRKFSDLAIRYSSFYEGKIEIAPKVPIKNLDDFSVWYTPGVAAVSKLIQRNRELSFDYTGRWNTVGIFTDGSRVLGLGDVGPEASLPVMEGKALLYKYLGGVDAIPLPIDAQGAERMVETIKALQPALGGVNLEDISSPKCFYLLEKLREELEIPVWHDDQQGTAGVTLAALLNALKLTDLKLSEARIVFFGAGAANIATARLLIGAGADAGALMLVDSKGILHPERDDIDQLLLKHRWKYELAIQTNRERRVGGIAEAVDGADVLIAASRPGPGLIKKELLEKMSEKAIVFALANPIPEIWPSVAKNAGAKIVATGRSDFPNQVNNSLIFPAVFRGVLDVRAKAITDEMIIVAAEELARYAQERGLHEDYILPTMVEWQVYPKVAAAVGYKAVELGLARKPLSKKELYQRAHRIIGRSKKLLKALGRAGLIRRPPRMGMK